MNGDLDAKNVTICGVKMRLIKTYISEKDEPIAIATNLLNRDFTDKELGEIYTRRWSSETANRDATVFEALDAFHARSYNGILQEIFACLILRFNTAIVIAEEEDLAKDFLEETYTRPSFKIYIQQICRYYKWKY